MSPPPAIFDDDNGDSPIEETDLPPATRNIMLTIAYDGTQYRGWQVQSNDLSVQECVENGVQKLTGEKRRVLCAGRTDSGVHALGQVANFHTASQVPIENIRRGLQSYLPQDITVISAHEVAPTFHATYSAIRKRYRYVIHDGDLCPPFLNNYLLRSKYHLDVECMSDAAHYLQGTHDFRCFESKFPNKMSSVRTIMEVSMHRLEIWQPWNAGHTWIPSHGRPHRHNDKPFIVFEVMADGFLYNMVRAIVGTLTEIGRGRARPEFMAEVIRSMDRSRAGMTAPPNGLYLVQVDYPEELLSNYSLT